MSSREWFMLDVRSGDPEALVARLFAAGFDAFFPKIRSNAVLPGYVLVNTDPDLEEPELQHCVCSAQFVTNEGNRPMCIPSGVAKALRSPKSELCNTLAVMAPEYRLDSLRHWFHPAAIRP